MSTIAAISTPNAVGGISIIRISGENAISIAEKVFLPAATKISEMSGYTCCYGKVFSDGEVIDEGILSVFKAPHSFTGEDIAEISCHGGIFNTKLVLRAVFAAGAVPAEAGEFTKRAFLNGKMSLTQAEAVMDLISSEGEQAHKCAVALHSGALFARIKKSSDALVKVLGELGAWVDYPEEDIPAVEQNTLLCTIGGILADLRQVLATYDCGSILREGIQTVILGRPNVGKSTLMNMLSGYERSIVNEIAGTTRDVVEESVRIGDVVLRLADTAGLRETGDLVEKVGVSLAYKKMESSVLVLAVFDNSQTLQHEDFQLIEKLVGRKTVAIINKSDKETLLDKEFIHENFEQVVEISAKLGYGIDALEQAIEEIFKFNSIDANAGVITNERQKMCVESAIFSLGEAVSALTIGETLDAVTILIDEAANSLLQLTGEKVTENVVTEVFSHFCVGK
ncbi:MAG: tRNA uridine-5-carboxymethylaminomethyl(34) synthesis GTPase MnmE [Oscillospiraceae bacterium]